MEHTHTSIVAFGPAEAACLVERGRSPLNPVWRRSKTFGQTSLWFPLRVRRGFEPKTCIVPANANAKGITTAMSNQNRRADRPASRITTAQRFADLAATWKSESAFMSSIHQAAMSPAYQEIIGLGYAAVPLLLAELRRKPAHWFWALAAITGENPVRPESRGNVRQMAQDWLAWGEVRGLAYGGWDARKQ